MKTIRWVGGWAVAWVLLTVALVSLWWPMWASMCVDCVPSSNPDAYGGTRLDINWVPTLLAAGVVAALVVVLVSIVVSRVLRGRPGSLS